MSRVVLLVAGLALAQAVLAQSPATPVFEGPIVEQATPQLTPRLSQLAQGAQVKSHEASEGGKPRVPPAWLMDRIGWGAEGGPVDALADQAFSRTPSRAPDVSVAGMGNQCGGCIPPDPMLAAGPNHVVQVVNASAMRIHDKTGAVILGPIQLKTLWTSGICATNDDGDPVVTYDWLADRWLVAQFSQTNQICVAVSQTPNPAGAYYVYQFATPNFPDYFKIAAWGDAYYVSANEDTYSAIALERTKMLAGQAATSIRFAGQSNFLMPAQLAGKIAPPAGTPGIYYTFKDSAFHGGGADRLEFYHFNANFTTPASSSFTLAQSVPITAYNYTVCGFFQLNCVPQLGTASRLDAVSEWPMWALNYRHFGAGDERLTGAFTIGGGSNVANIRWFEVRRNGASAYTLRQEGTVGDTTTHRFMPSIAMDQCGNLGLGYNASSSTINPALRYALRLRDDALGTMQAEATLHAGTGSQTSNRWGDYAAVVLDPADECSFWMTGEHYNANSGNQWQTRIGKFKLAQCSATCGQPAATLSVDDVSISEGNAGTKVATFTVTRSNNAATVTVLASASSITAFAGTDFAALAPQTITFTPGGALTATVQVTINGDSVVEGNETFQLALSDATNATIADATGTGTITNDDIATIAIADVTQAEGNAGTTQFGFTLTLTGSVQDAFSLDFSTTNGTAGQPGDYQAANGTLVWPGGQSTRTINVQVVGDTILEAAETFTLGLSNATLAGISFSDATGVGTITNDDAPTIAIGDVSQAEGTGAATMISLPVTVTGGVQGGFTLPYTVVAGTASAGDFTAAPGSLDFTGAVGEVQSVSVQIAADAIVEPDETFVVQLGTPSVAGITVADAQGMGTIDDDDTATIAIDDVALAEGNAGTTSFVFTVTLTGAVQGGFSVDYATVDGTATQPADYAAASGTLAFAGTLGETRTIQVPVVGDTAAEPAEAFTVVLATPGNASVTRSDGAGLGTILTDDQVADIRVTVSDDVTAVVEGQPTTYTVLVQNVGTGDAAAVSVVQTATPGLVGFSWSCAGAGGAVCSETGAGLVDTTRAIPAGGLLVWRSTAQVSATAPATVATTFTATVQAPGTEAEPADNAATDTDDVRPDALFSNGFE